MTVDFKSRSLEIFPFYKGPGVRHEEDGLKV